MGLDKFILLPGYSAERILISATTEPNGRFSVHREQLQPRPQALFLLLERERKDPGNEVETTPTNNQR